MAMLERAGSRLRTALRDPKKRGSNETIRRFDVFARGVCDIHGLEVFGTKPIIKSSGDTMWRAVENGFADEFGAFLIRHQGCLGLQLQARVYKLWLSRKGAGTWEIDTELNSIRRRRF